MFDFLKLLTKHRISLIVNLIMDLIHGLQIEKSACTETDFVSLKALYVYLISIFFFLVMRYNVIK